MKKRNYTEPQISKHDSDLSKDWYVFFQYKQDGRIYKFKKREGVNRIKNLEDRLFAIKELHKQICIDLTFGWNPLLDPKREGVYNKFLSSNRKATKKKKEITFSKVEIFAKFLNK